MNKLIDEFKSVIESSEIKLRSISGEKSALKSSPYVWSSKEILGHLVDSSINNIVRFVNGQFQEDLIFSGYDQNKWVNAQNYQEADWNFIIDLWKQNNLQIIRIIETIPNYVFSRLHETHNYDVIAWVEVPKEEPSSLEYLVRDYLGHMKHHLDVIFKKNSIEESR